MTPPSARPEGAEEAKGVRVVNPATAVGAGASSALLSTPLMKLVSMREAEQVLLHRCRLPTAGHQPPLNWRPPPEIDLLTPEQFDQYHAEQSA